MPDERRTVPLWQPRFPNPGAGDVVAGLTVALILVPQALAYAVLAGMPPVVGLTVGAVATIAAAPFVSSPFLQTGPVAITSLLTFGALAGLAEPAGDRYVALAALLAVLVGTLRLLIGLFRAGAVAYLMSQPVLAGFTPAAGIVIIVSQLPGLFGVETDGRAPLEILPVVADPRGWDLHTVAIGLLTVATMLAAQRIHRLFPAVLAAAVVGWVAAGLTGYGGARLGDVPAGLPRLDLGLPLGSFGELMIPAVVIALVGFAEPAAIARNYAQQTRQAWDADREFVSQGVANVASGIFGGFPAGGSFSRSAVARNAGAETAWSGALTGLVLLAVMPFVGVLEALPRTVLSAIIAASVLGLLSPADLTELRRVSPRQFIVGILTLVLTLVLAPRIQDAVIVGVLVSIVIHLYRELSIETPSWREDEVLHVRPAGVLYFGSTHRLEDRLTVLLSEHPDIDRLVVHAERLGRVDVTGALALKRIGESLGDAGVRLEIVNTTHTSEKVVDRAIRDDPAPVADPQDAAEEPRL